MNVVWRVLLGNKALLLFNIVLTIQYRVMYENKSLGDPFSLLI